MRIGLSKKKLLALDWDKRSLRLVLVRRHGEALDLLKAVSIPIPPEIDRSNPESFGAFVREGMRQARIGTKQVVMCIPRDQVVLNTLRLPPTPSDELPSVVQFQTVKELPFSAEQATLDFTVGEEFDPKAPSTAVAAAVRNDELSYYKSVAKEAGLTIERIGLRPYANRVAITRGEPDILRKTVLVVEVGPQLTEIDILRDGAIAFSRAASVSLPDFSSQGEGGTSQDSRISTLPIHDRESDDQSRAAVNSLMVDIVRSFEAYRATDATVSLDKIVVCGSSGIEAELAESLAARFAARAELYSPERLLDLSPRRAMELRGFSAAIGLALGHGGDTLADFDFLHPTRPVSKGRRQAKKIPAIAATVALFVGSGVMFHLKFIVPKLEQVKALTERYNEKKQQEDPITDFKAQVEALEGWMKSEQVWPEVVLALTEVLPDDKIAYVTRLNFETKPERKQVFRTSSLKMKLRTAALGQINEISSSLREYGFENVKPGKDPATGHGLYTCDTSVELIIPRRKPAEQEENKTEEATSEGEASEVETEASAPTEDGVSLDSIPLLEESAQPTPDKSRSTHDRGGESRDSGRRSPSEPRAPKPKADVPEEKAPAGQAEEPKDGKVSAGTDEAKSPPKPETDGKPGEEKRGKNPPGVIGNPPSVRPPSPPIPGKTLPSPRSPGASEEGKEGTRPRRGSRGGGRMKPSDERVPKPPVRKRTAPPSRHRPRHGAARRPASGKGGAE